MTASIPTLFNLPSDLPRRYKYNFRAHLFAGTWRVSYELIGARGGMHLHVSGPHVYDNRENYSSGLETHRRTPWPSREDEPPSQDECWLLKCPCWHDGTSLYAEEHYLPKVLAGDHADVFRSLVRDADEQFAFKSEPVEIAS